MTLLRSTSSFVAYNWRDGWTFKRLNDVENARNNRTKQWRERKEEERKLKRKKWYDSNQESLKEKARERMKRLQEERKSRKIVQTHGLHKAQEHRDIGAEKKREAKKKKQEDEEKRRQQARERQRRLREKKRKEKDSSGEANREESSPEEDATVFPSRMAKKHVKDKVTSVFPRSPRKKRSNRSGNGKKSQ